jgi:Putative peptidoglycan binding domain
VWNDVIAATVPVGVGFVLTGVLGALLTTRLQSRAWQRQDQMLQRRNQREQRLAAFEEISGLLDSRLYAMRQVWWALRQQVRGLNTLDLQAALQNYRAALAAWNNGLNRLAALVQIHFGPPARSVLEDVRKDFQALGFALDEMLKADSRRELKEPADVPSLGWRFGALEDRIYAANLILLSILDGQPSAEPAYQVPPASRLLGLGMRGDAVRELQRTLAAGLAEDLLVDGLFGWKTERALRRYQRQQGLPVHGVTDAATWAALGEAKADQIA